MQNILHRIFAAKAFYYYSSFAVLLILITQLIDFNGLYGQDAYEYCRYTNLWKLFFTSQQKPPEFFWPIYYPLIGSIFSLLFKTHFALQLISILSFAFNGYLLEKIITRLYSISILDSRVFVTLTFILSPYVLRASVIVMSDMLCVLFIISSFYWVLKSVETTTLKSICIAVAFMTLSVLTRYAAIAVIAPMFIYLFLCSYKRMQLYFFIAVLLIAILLLLPHFFVQHTILNSVTNHDWLNEWSLTNLFRRSFQNNNGNYAYILPNIVHSFSALINPGFIAIGIILIVLTRPSQLIRLIHLNLILLIIIIYSLFLAGIPFQNNRFLLLTFPFILMVFYPSFNRLVLFLQSKKFYTIFVLLFIFFQLVFSIKSIYPYYESGKFEKNISTEINSFPAKTLYTFSIDPALNYYGCPHKLINLWTNKLSSIDSNAYLLFNETDFETEFKDKNPMINFNFIKSNKKLVKLKDFEKGWILYELR